MLFGQWRVCALAQLLIAVLLVGCGAEPPSEAPVPQQSTWNTFWNAFADELLGEPGDTALKELAHFEQAGIAFDYPAVLRLSVDAQKPQWQLSRGDFELEMNAYASATLDARNLIDAMASYLHHGKDPPEGPQRGDSVHWCGQDITPWRVRLTLLGDRHEYLAYDLPAPPGEARVLVFSDLVHEGALSRTAQATLAAISASVRCTATPLSNTGTGAD